MSQLTVARYLETHFAQCGKSQTQIAKEMDYKKPNILSMFKKGETKLPIDKIGPIAQAIGADPVFLFKLAMQEYFGPTWKAIEPIVTAGPMLTKHELDMISLMRESFQGNQVDLDDPRIETMARKAFAEMAAKQSSFEDASRERYNNAPANAKNYG